MSSPYDLAITVIAVLALGFVLLGIFYPTIEHHLGLGEGTPGQRFYSVAIGVALMVLLVVFRLARDSMAAI